MLRSLLNKPSVENFNKSLSLIRKYSVKTNEHVQRILKCKRLSRRPSYKELFSFVVCLHYNFIMLKHLRYEKDLQLLSPLLTYLISSKLNGKIWTQWKIMVRQELVDPEDSLVMLTYLRNHLKILRNRRNEWNTTQSTALKPIYVNVGTDAGGSATPKKPTDISISESLPEIDSCFMDSMDTELMISLWGSAKRCQAHFIDSIDCYLCKRPHNLSNCSKFRMMSTNDRLLTVSKLRMCSICLEQEHQLDECSSTELCAVCKMTHNTLLHPEDGPQSSTSSPSALMGTIILPDGFVIHYRIVPRKPPTE